MPRVTPRRVAALIARSFPWVRENPTQGIRPEMGPKVRAMLRLVRRIPVELLPSGEDWLTFEVAMGILESYAEHWSGTSDRGAPALGAQPELGTRNPLAVIVDLLESCPDEGTREDSPELAFIKDADLRAVLRRDFSSARTALDHGEWKAATVLAGSVVEALLLYALASSTPTERETARQAWVARQKRPTDPGLTRPLPADLDEWVLGQLIWIAHTMRVVDDGTAAAADVARDFRNLIHPGRARRIGAPADEGTAHSAYGAAKRVAGALDV